MRNVPKEKLRTIRHRIIEALQYIHTENIEQKNKLIYAAARHACTECGVRINNTDSPNKYIPPWQRRIEGKILQLRKDLSRIHEMERGVHTITQATSLRQKYRLTQKSFPTVKEEIKQKIRATSAKLRRYTQRINQYKINKTFATNEGQVYKQFENKEQTNIMVTEEISTEIRNFWTNIWGNSCLLYTSPSPRDKRQSRMPSSA